MKLVKPSVKHRESFLAAAEELRNDTSRKYGAEAEVIAETFDKYVKMLEDYSKGVNLPTDYVPSTDYWLVDVNEYIGRVTIRHRLNESLEKLGGHIGYTIRPSKRTLGYGTKMLEIALPKAKKLRLEKVLLMCDKTNIASAKIIEKNGGKFQDEQEQGKGKPPKLRYWIILE